MSDNPRILLLSIGLEPQQKLEVARPLVYHPMTSRTDADKIFELVL